MKMIKLGQTDRNYCVVEFKSTKDTEKRGTLHIGLSMMMAIQLVVNCNAFGKLALIIDNETYEMIKTIEKGRFLTYQEVKNHAIYFDTID